MSEVLLVDCYPDNWKDRIPHYTRLFEQIGRQGMVVDYRVVGAGYPVPSVDAAVVSGSPMMLSEQSPPAGLADFVRELECPVLGICFGHQLLGMLSGAAVRSGERIEGFRSVRVVKQDSLFEGLPGEVSLLESHREYLVREEVEDLEWEVIAVSDFCPVEAMRHTVRRWYGVQFHPERSGPSGDAVVRNFLELVVPELGAWL